MKRNMGTIDRAVRFAVGVALAAFVLLRPVSGIAAVLLGIVSLAMIVTAIFAFCPAYLPLGISTCPPSERRTTP
jgi:hypothetical protein